jgi:hypothetical protein
LFGCNHDRLIRDSHSVGIVDDTPFSPESAGYRTTVPQPSGGHRSIGELNSGETAFGPSLRSKHVLSPCQENQWRRLDHRLHIPAISHSTRPQTLNGRNHGVACPSFVELTVTMTTTTTTTTTIMADTSTTAVRFRLVRAIGSFLSKSRLSLRKLPMTSGLVVSRTGGVSRARGYRRC